MVTIVVTATELDGDGRTSFDLSDSRQWMDVTYYQANQQQIYLIWSDSRTYTGTYVPALDQWRVQVSGTIQTSETAYSPEITITYDPITFTDNSFYFAMRDPSQVEPLWTIPIDAKSIILAASYEYHGSDGDDNFVATPAGGTATGGAGNDTLHGGAGIDTAVFTGKFSDYQITYDAGTQTFTVKDLRDGTPDGTDTLSSFELLDFSDGERALSVPDPNQPPSAVSLTDTLASVAENTAIQTHLKVGDIDVTDDGSGTNTLALTGADKDYFEIVGTALYLKAGTVLDFETKHSYSVAVTVDDTTVGDTPDATSTTYTLNVSDVNEGSPPANLTLKTAVIKENAANGTLVGLLSATDPDAGDTLSFSLTDDASGRFKIIGNQLQLANGLLLDYEQHISHSVTVRVTDHAGLWLDKTFVITVQDVSPENVTGDAHDNIIMGGKGNDVLNGGGGADTMTGGAGNDTYYVDDANDKTIELSAKDGTDTVIASRDWALGDFLENLTLAAGAGNINGTGNALANTIIGNEGNNRLDGGAGNDTLKGGAGDDTYVVDSAGDKLTENANAGTDKVESSVTWTLGLNFENLTLTESASINGIGNAVANVITGNSGNNILDGKAGADTMSGGAGNDTYYVENSGDTVSETSAGDGTDTVISTISYVLGQYLENLTLIGSAAINGTGNERANVIIGNGASNIIDGGAGSDKLDGAGGIDTISYATAATGVTVDISQKSGIGTTGGDTDTLLNFENITGSAHDDTLIGNSLANVINGGAGADAMTGGAGNDTYYVDDIHDTVSEVSAKDGTDTVISTVDFTLGNFVENLTLAGAGSVNATGNALNNILIGNTGYNRLDGGAGADTMKGGAGNDTYVVDNAGDKLTENLNEGTDTVEASVTWTLGKNFENLTLTGSAAINGTGNELSNAITGNAANNTLKGGAGADTFVFLGAHFGVDTVADFIATGTAHDTLQFDSTVFADQGTARSAATQVGKDVFIYTSADHTTDYVILKNVALAALSQDDFAILA